MKYIKLIPLLAVCALSMAGCEKTDVDEAPYGFVGADDARLKVIYASAYTTNPGVQLSIDDVRVSSVITGRTPYPGGGYNTTGSNFGDYLLVEPGQRKLTIAIPKKNTNVDSIVLYTTNFTVEAGKAQSILVSDTFTRTKSVVVEDVFAKYPTDGLTYRFVNLMPNVPFADLYFGTTLVATGIAYNSAGVVFTMPGSTASQTWSIRETGASPTSTALATYASGNTVINRRTYTAFAMGYKGSSATATKPYISFAINR